MKPQSPGKTTRLRRMLLSRPALTRKAELKRLRAENARYKALVETAPIGYFTLDAKMCIVEINPTGARFLAAAKSELQHTPFLSFIKPEDQQHVVEEFARLSTRRNSTVNACLTIDNRTCPVTLQLTASESPLDRTFICQVAMIDLSEQKAAKENLRIARDGLQHVANHDPLTRLPNRCGFKDQLQSALNNSGKKKVALLLLDLDHFKQVNDPLGHQTGDKLLREVADRLLSSVKKIDTVGRLGGDEFAIIMKDINEVSEVAAIAEKISDQLALPYKSVSQDIHLAASIGISVYPVHTDNARELICFADAAMNQAKSRGRNRIQFYTDALNITLTKRFELERDLRIALRKSQFELYYQPQYDLKSGSVSGYEVLLRWNHPTRGIIGPENFIDVAEATGLIEPLGEWILAQACERLVELRAQNKNLKLSVNVSAKQFSKGDFRDKIVKILSRTRIPAESLELELTESALLENVEQSISTLEVLRQAGVSLAIDDFGTGYSSFSRLQQLPVSRVKIDRSFIQNIPTNQSNCCISRAMISVAHDLGIEVVAEGVETHQQALFLSEAGCDVLQGYYVGRPKAFNQMTNKARLRTVEETEEVA